MFFSPQTLARLEAERLKAVLFVQRRWKEKQTRAFFSKVLFKRLGQIGQRRAQRGRSKTEGLQSTGYSFLWVLDCVKRIQSNVRTALMRRALWEMKQPKPYPHDFLIVRRATVRIQRSFRTYLLKKAMKEGGASAMQLAFANAFQSAARMGNQDRRSNYYSNSKNWKK